MSPFNRRGFLTRCAGAAVAAFALPFVATAKRPDPITLDEYRGLYISGRQVMMLETREDHIRDAYRHYLGREATDVEVRAWIANRP